LLNGFTSEQIVQPNCVRYQSVRQDTSTVFARRNWRKPPEILLRSS